MSLRNYLEKSYEPCEEIRSGFDQEQVQQLHNLLKEIGYKKYLSFVVEHQADILRYIGLSRSQRLQKKWVNHPNNLLIRLAALQISGATVELMNNIESIAEVVDSGSYRKFHSIVADGLAPLLLQFPYYHFPFEGYSNPFHP